MIYDFYYCGIFSSDSKGKISLKSKQFASNFYLNKERERKKEGILKMTVVVVHLYFCNYLLLSFIFLNSDSKTREYEERKVIYLRR